METTHRIDYFDVAKGCLIVAVILYHYHSAGVDFSKAGLPEFPVLKKMMGFVATFFMPCFFIISGFFISQKKTWKEFIISQIRKLLVPLFFFGALESICFSTYHPFADAYPWVNPYKAMLGSLLWFLWALFFSRIIVYAIYKWTGRPCLCLAACLALSFLGIVLHWLGLEITSIFTSHTLIACSFVAFGLFLRNHAALFVKAMKLCLFAYPILYILAHLSHIPVPNFTQGIGITRISHIPLFFVFSITGSLFMLHCCKHIFGKAKGFFVYFGQNSLVVYCVHLYFLFLFMSLFRVILYPQSVASEIAYISITMACTIAICVLFIQLMKTRGLRQVLGNSAK